jgi:hypothetical protein
MNIDDLTPRQIKELKSLLPEYKTQKTKTFFEIGQIYLVRTVTMIVVGELIDFNDQELLFAKASWIADTGRFSDALKDVCKIKEIEPFTNNAIVGRGGLIDATIIKADLPLQQK